MPRSVYFLLLFFLPIAGNAQQTKVVLTKLGNWDNDQLPSIGNQTFNDLWGWTSATGREYAIMGSTDSTYFIEVTDPYHPVVRDAEPGRYNHCIHRDYQTYRHYCYAAGGEGQSSLQIFDLQYLPDSVHKVYDSDSLMQMAHAIYLDSTGASARLYLCTLYRPDVGEKPLAVLSLANPEKPFLLAINKPPVDPFNVPAYEIVHEMYARGDTTWLSCGTDGLFIFNYADARKPVLLSSIRPPYTGNGWNHSNWLTANGNYLIFTDENNGSPLKLYDVSKLKTGSSDVEMLSVFGSHSDSGSIPHDPFIRGNLVFVSYYHEGIAVFDISNPKSPKLLARYDTYPQDNSISDPDKRYQGMNGCWGAYPFFPSGHIIASDQTNGLFVLELDTLNGIEKLPEKVAELKAVNPISEKLSFTFTSDESRPGEVFLYDTGGQLVFSDCFPKPAGNILYSHALPGELKSGCYIFYFRCGDYEQSVPLFHP